MKITFSPNGRFIYPEIGEAIDFLMERFQKALGREPPFYRVDYDSDTNTIVVKLEPQVVFTTAEMISLTSAFQTNDIYVSADVESVCDTLVGVVVLTIGGDWK